MKTVKFMAIVRNGHGGIGYVSDRTDDYKRTKEFYITRRLENAYHFQTYSNAIDTLLELDTTGWKFSEIERVKEEA